MSPARTGAPHTRPLWAALLCTTLVTGVVSTLGQSQRDTPVAGVVPTAQPDPRTAGISGVVTSDEADSRPVRRAVVTLKGEGVLNRGDITDDEGRFAVGSLPAGRFTLTVAKAGWVTTIYGAKRPWRPPGVAITLAAGQQVENITVRMMRGAVITGHITDETGRPIVLVRPVLYEPRAVGGERRLLAVASPGMPVMTTDDVGEYRFYGLPPGEYFVTATAPGLGDGLGRGFRRTTAEDVQSARSAGPPPRAEGGSSLSYATTYYPGALDPNDATSITLVPGEERRGVDFVVTAVSTATVEGTVTRGGGAPVANARVNLTPMSGGSASAPLVGVAIPVRVTGPDGRFSFPAVRPGRYVLGARASTTGTPGPAGRPGGPAQAALDLWARTEVFVAGQDVQGVSLTLERGATVSGRVEFIGVGAPPASAGVQVVLHARNATAVDQARLTQPSLPAGDRFMFEGIPPGRYRIAASITAMADRWAVQSVTMAGRDISGEEIDIQSAASVPEIVVSITDQISELSGVLSDSLGRPVPEFFVFAFPARRSAWTEDSLRLHPPVRPGSDGRFRIAPLAPGPYHVVALTGFEEIDYLDVAFLEQLVPGAVDVTIAAGEKKVQDLKLAQ